MQGVDSELLQQLLVAAASKEVRLLRHDVTGSCLFVQSLPENFLSYGPEPSHCSPGGQVARKPRSPCSLQPLHASTHAGG